MPTLPGANRNHALDGLRGWLAVSVCLYHGMLIPDPSQTSRIIAPAIQQLATPGAVAAKLAFTVLNGDLAVTVFFVMSGCVLFESMQRLEQLPAWRQIAVLCTRRVFRIYPALLFALSLFWALFALAQWAKPSVFQLYFNAWQWLQNAALWKITMYGAAWTLQVEILAVPFIVIAFWLSHALGVVGLLLFLGYSVLASGQSDLVFGLPVINGALPAFAGGFLIPGVLGRTVAQEIPNRAWIAIALMLVFGPMFVPYGSSMAIITQALFASLLVSIVYWQQSRGLNHALTCRISALLGVISYSFYLLNPIALELLLRAIGVITNYPPARLDRGLLLGVLAVLATIPVAMWSTHYVERPGINLARLLTRGFALFER